MAPRTNIPREAYGSMDTLIDVTIFVPTKSRPIYLGRSGSSVHTYLLCSRLARTRTKSNRFLGCRGRAFVLINRQTWIFLWELLVCRYGFERVL